MARPCFGEGSLNCECTFTQKAAVAWKLIYQTQTPPYVYCHYTVWQPLFPITVLTSEVEMRSSADPSFISFFWTCPRTISDYRCNLIYFPILWLYAKTMWDMKKTVDFPASVPWYTNRKQEWVASLFLRGHMLIINHCSCWRQLGCCFHSLVKNIKEINTYINK